MPQRLTLHPLCSALTYELARWSDPIRTHHTHECRFLSGGKQSASVMAHSPILICGVLYFIIYMWTFQGTQEKKIPLAGLIDVWCPLQQLGPFVVEKDAVAHFMIMAVAIQSSMGGGWFSRIGTLVSSIAHVFFGFWVSARTTHHY